MRRVPPLTSVRAAAFAIDHLVAVVLLALVAFGSALFVSDPTAPAGAVVHSGLLFGPVLIGYKTVMEGRYGRTHGKASRNIAVRRTDGSACGWPRAALRNVALVVDYAFFIGFVVASATEDNRRIGDLLADTVVVEQ